MFLAIFKITVYNSSYNSLLRMLIKLFREKLLQTQGFNTTLTGCVTTALSGADPCSCFTVTLMFWLYCPRSCFFLCIFLWSVLLRCNIIFFEPYHLICPLTKTKTMTIIMFCWYFVVAGRQAGRSDDQPEVLQRQKRVKIGGGSQNKVSHADESLQWLCWAGSFDLTALGSNQRSSSI